MADLTRDVITEYLKKSPEIDNKFHKVSGDEQLSTFWGSTLEKHTKFYTSVQTIDFANKKLGDTHTHTFQSSCDGIFAPIINFTFPGIRADIQDSDTEVAYKNCPALYAMDSVTIKKDNRVRYYIDGRLLFFYMQLTGDLLKYAECIGYAATEQQLIQDSKKTRKLFAPLKGLPMATTENALLFSDNRNQTITIEIKTKSIIDMYKSTSVKNGLYINPKLPIMCDTGTVLCNDAAPVNMTTRCVWLSKIEKEANAKLGREIVYKTMRTIAVRDVQAKDKSVTIDMILKGPYAWLLIAVQNLDDYNQNWTRYCNSAGDDYVESYSLQVNGQHTSDAIPALYGRTFLPDEVFGHFPNCHLYLLPFELKNDAPSGQRSFELGDKLLLTINLKPGTDNLRCQVIGSMYECINSLDSENDE